jgi:hypothetical protein
LFLRRSTVPVFGRAHGAGVRFFGCCTESVAADLKRYTVPVIGSFVQVRALAVPLVPAHGVDDPTPAPNSCFRTFTGLNFIKRINEHRHRGPGTGTEVRKFAEHRHRGLTA